LTRRDAQRAAEDAVAVNPAWIYWAPRVWPWQSQAVAPDLRWSSIGL